MGAGLQESGRTITAHSANLPLVTIFTLHLKGATENAGPYVEFSSGGSDCYLWQYDVYDKLPVAVDGKVQVPQGPAGYRGPRELLQKAQYQVSEADETFYQPVPLIPMSESEAATG